MIEEEIDKVLNTRFANEQSNQTKTKEKSTNKTSTNPTKGKKPLSREYNTNYKKESIKHVRTTTSTTQKLTAVAVVLLLFSVATIGIWSPYLMQQPSRNTSNILQENGVDDGDSSPLGYGMAYTHEIYNPYEQVNFNTVNHYKANLHTHTKYQNITHDIYQIFLTWLDNPQTTMTIQWRTDENINTYLVIPKEGICILADRKDLSDHKDWDTVTYHHRVTVTGLEPATEYFFYIQTEQNQRSETYSFMTVSYELMDELRFHPQGDYRSQINHMIAMMQESASREPLFAAAGGDFVNDGFEENDWENFLNGWSEYMITDSGRKIPMVPSIGNHEAGGSPPYLYFEIFDVPQNYTLDFGDMVLITLDSGHNVNGGATTDPNLIETHVPWLEQQLQLYQEYEWIFVQYHVPAWPSHKTEETNEKIRQHWVPLFEQYDVDVVFESHDHCWKYTPPIKENQAVSSDIPGSVRYIGDGGMGAPLREPDLTRWWIEDGKKAYNTWEITLEKNFNEQKTYLWTRGVFKDIDDILNPFILTKEWNEPRNPSQQSLSYTGSVDCNFIVGSDGHLNAYEVIDLYHSAGYNILAITDHKNYRDVIYNTWPWSCFIHQNPAAASQSSEYYADLDMLAIHGNEPSANHHHGSLLNDYTGNGNPLSSSFNYIQDNDGLSLFYHPGRYTDPNAQYYQPTWTPQWYNTFFDEYRQTLLGIEVYNQGNRYGPNAGGYAGDVAWWDSVNKLREPDDLVWGFSNDDFHGITHEFRNYQHMLMNSLTEEEFRTAMNNGAFYFSIEPNGANQQSQTYGQADTPKLTDVDVTGSIITISGLEYTQIQWYDDTTTVIGEGESFDVSTITSNFVRAVLINDHGRTYTQPFGYRRIPLNNPLEKEGWELVFHDEFSATTLDSAWKTDQYFHFSKTFWEPQYYTIYDVDYRYIGPYNLPIGIRDSNFIFRTRGEEIGIEEPPIESGVTPQILKTLSLVYRKEPGLKYFPWWLYQNDFEWLEEKGFYKVTNHPLNPNTPNAVYGPMNDTSAWIQTKDTQIDFTYGYFEIRCRVPNDGVTLWPAFWLYRHDSGIYREIDIFEFFGWFRDAGILEHTPGFNMHINYTQNSQPKRTYPGRYTLTGPYANVTEYFHIYAVRWTPNVVVWYVDNVERHRVKGDSPYSPMRIIANLAAMQYKNPEPYAYKNLKLPAEFEIDYIRAYRSLDKEFLTDWANYDDNKVINDGGVIGEWELDDDDIFTTGDFLGDGRDILITINPTKGTARLLQYSLGSWQTTWDNERTPGYIGAWELNPDQYYEFITGDFTGNNKDELLAINRDTGEAMLLYYMKGIWNMHWSSTQQGGGFINYISDGTCFVSGDVTGNGVDELYLSNSDSSIVRLYRYSPEEKTWVLLWKNLDTKSQRSLYGDVAVMGDFNGDGQQTLFVVNTQSQNAWLYQFTGSGWNQLWTSGDTGKINGWYIHADDIFIAGDFDANGKDNLLAFGKNGWSAMATYNSFGSFGQDSHFQWDWQNEGSGTLNRWNMIYKFTIPDPIDGGSQGTIGGLKISYPIYFAGYFSEQTQSDPSYQELLCLNDGFGWAHLATYSDLP